MRSVKKIATGQGCQSSVTAVKINPPVIGLIARLRRRDFFMPQTKIKEFSEKGAKMNSTVLDLTPFTRREGEVLLNKDVLDNQLIDVDGKRVVRVNDVQLIKVGRAWRVSGADVSLQGFVRRLMPQGFYGSSRVVEVLDWADVGYLATDTATATVQLKSSRTNYRVSIRLKLLN